MAHLVFVHGWGCEPAIWTGVANQLNDHSNHFIDQGFFGKAKFDLPSEPFIFVTHSMGLIWALENRPDHCQGIAAMNGFSKFARADDWPMGVHPRVLQRMIRQFERDGAAVWQTFMGNAGWQDAELPQGADFEKLQKALETLLQSDGRALYAELNRPICVIASTADQIVPPSLSTASFGEAVTWVENAGHMLMVSHSDQVALRINDFLETLDLE